MKERDEDEEEIESIIRNKRIVQLFCVCQHGEKPIERL